MVNPITRWVDDPDALLEEVLQRRYFQTIYAVVLMYNLSWMEGIILGEFVQKRSKKIGNFYIEGSLKLPVPQTETVN